MLRYYWENYQLLGLVDHLGSQLAPQVGVVELMLPEGFRSIEKNKHTDTITTIYN